MGGKYLLSSVASGKWLVLVSVCLSCFIEQLSSFCPQGLSVLRCKTWAGLIYSFMELFYKIHFGVLFGLLLAQQNFSRCPHQIMTVIFYLNNKPLCATTL